MSATTVLDVERPSVVEDDELYHWYCHDENRALCGTDLTEALECEPGDELVCVVCEELADLTCETCGYQP